MVKVVACVGCGVGVGVSCLARLVFVERAFALGILFGGLF